MKPRHKRERQREDEPDAEVDPGRQRVARREDGRRVRADADERRLPERRLAGHAGEQHETQRDDAVEPDVVAERHPELRRDERNADQHRERRRRSRADARGSHAAAHSSSS